jgi:Mrp family chromosome partitioning ATPase
MAKLLETLRQRDGGTVPALPLPSRPVAVESVLPTHAEAQPRQEEEEYLFIEVGPDKKIDGSPAVLAKPGPAAAVARRPPGLVAESKSATVAAPVMRPSRPMSVAFEPWPGDVAKYVAPEIITYHQPDHAASKQYAELFEKVSEGLGGSRAILFTGAVTKSGTTTVLLNLAFSGCRHKRRVAVIEGNLARPALDERLGLQAKPGWHEFLAGQVGLEKALQQTAEPGLAVLTAGTGTRSGLSPEAYRWALGWLRERFDLVLIDAPEASDHAALTVLVPSADGVYLVLPQNTTETHQLGDVAPSIVRMGGRLRGLIHTQFESL